MGRSASHYRSKSAGPARSSTSAHSARDAMYRRALGIEDAGPLPREIGSVRHQRGDKAGTTYLD